MAQYKGQNGGRSLHITEEIDLNHRAWFLVWKYTIPGIEDCQGQDFAVFNPHHTCCITNRLCLLGWEDLSDVSSEQGLGQDVAL